MCRRTERGCTCCCDCTGVRNFCSQLCTRAGNLCTRLCTRLEGLCRPRMATSTEDVRTVSFWKAVAAEFLGTLFLVFIGCGSTVTFGQPQDVVRIGLAFGITVAIVIYCIARISGGHINPAVSLAMLATRKISLARALLYCVAQLIGAMLGAGLLYGVTPHFHRSPPLGATVLGKLVTPEQGFGMEFIITFIFIFVILATNDSGKEELKVWCPLLVGLTVVVCHMVAVPYTGCGMNTARSFGPAVVSGAWRNHWIYWFGPIIGGMAGGLFYDYIFASNASFARARACVMANEFEGDNDNGKQRRSPEHKPMKPASRNTCPGSTFVEIDPPEKVADTDPESDGGIEMAVVEEKRKSHTSLTDEKRKSYTSLVDEKRKSQTSLADEKRKSTTSLSDEKRKSRSSLVENEEKAQDVSTAKSVVG